MERSATANVHPDASDPAMDAIDEKVSPEASSRFGIRQRFADFQLRSRIFDKKNLRHLPIVLIVTFYIVWVSLLSLGSYFGYASPPFDLAVFDQGLWLLSHLHTPFVTVMGRNLFGDHTSFILLLLVPFYRLAPEPGGILVLQSIVVGVTAVPIYKLASRHIGGVIVPTTLAGSFLLNPALQQGNLEQFHPEALQVLIITLAIYAAIESRGRMLALMVVLALLVKEDAGFLVLPLGIWVYARRNRIWGIEIVVSSALWTVVALKALIPAFLGSGSLYSNRIPFGGVTGLFSTIIKHPGQFFTFLHQDNRPFYLWQMGFSFGWGFLLAPEIAAIALLAFLELELSTFPYMHQILYHYSMSIVAVLAIGTVFAVGAQKTADRRNIATSIIFVCAFWSSLLWGLMPYSIDHISARWTSGSQTGKAISYVERAIPPNAIVAAWYPYVAHIDHRTQIYVWPNPFSTANWGLGTNNLRLPAASMTAYLMLPVPLTSSDDPEVFDKIKRNYRLVRSDDHVGLYELKTHAASSG